MIINYCIQLFIKGIQNGKDVQPEELQEIQNKTVSKQVNNII